MRSYAPPPPPHGPQPHKGARPGAQRERALLRLYAPPPPALLLRAVHAWPLRCEINNKAITNHSGQRGARGSESNDEC